MLAFLKKIPTYFEIEGMSWLHLVNENLKWAFTFLCRLFSIALAVIIIIYTLKVTGVVKDLRKLIMEDGLNIIPLETEIISSPEVDYTKDLIDIDSVLQLLESKQK